jgi:probable rRNA maturation factor
MQDLAIKFHSECDFQQTNPETCVHWLSAVAKEEGKLPEEINYIFCDDTYLHKINLEFLSHDDYTDIITFDYSVGDTLIGDVYVSAERVLENSKTYSESFVEEMDRVLVHGLLHLCGYKDKTTSEAVEMRNKENYYLSLRA